MTTTAKTLSAGDRVRMSEALKAKLRSNGSADHLREFGDCYGIVLGLVVWSTDAPPGPEVDVRWHPSCLRYGYLPEDLDLYPYEET